ncbi:MAG: imidazoleglycerol-phosphate dehydratase HisB [Verrucomicrobiaceae bacterium]|nr:imidazoleglycerol-phosphate dehydratase HisB [Verrucomicrobiaceae bacterium]
MPEPRTSSQNRETAETRISAELVIDGSGESTIDTGIPFLDHMLTLFARHSLCDLKISAKGDIEVDYHHTVEDVGIVLGSCFKEALGNKHGISRYGWALLPMDETLSRVAIDFGGRPFIAFRAPDKVDSIREFSFGLVEEFLRAFANNAAANVHVEVIYGRDAHHMAESIFKGLAKAIDLAARRDSRVTGIPSTKETL